MTLSSIEDFDPGRDTNLNKILTQILAKSWAAPDQNVLSESLFSLKSICPLRVIRGSIRPLHGLPLTIPLTL